MVGVHICTVGVVHNVGPSDRLTNGTVGNIYGYVSAVHLGVIFWVKSCDL